MKTARSIVRRVSRDMLGHTPDELLAREWLVTNGLGGYASGTIVGVSTRRYHGLLIAALPAPLGRTMMFNHLTEMMRTPDDRTFRFGGSEKVGGVLDLEGAPYLREFRLEGGLPVWRYEADGVVFEKRIVLPHLQNTVYIRYSLLGGADRVRLKLRPSMDFRSHDAEVGSSVPNEYTLTSKDSRYEFQDHRGTPPLRMHLDGLSSAFTVERMTEGAILFRTEESRGYRHTGELWSPGYFRVDLTLDKPATLMASTESWTRLDALSPKEAFIAEEQRREHLLHDAPKAAQSGLGAELVLAADQFIISPSVRVEDSTRARALGGEARTVIAGYHWFTDWGRDTMISLEGLTLSTGRITEARDILRTFSRYVRDGLIPNMFPEGENEGLYHTADATLWFFHAIKRYVDASGDVETLELLIPKLEEIVACHLRGTKFGIGVDERDGLLRQGAPGYQLTWMDAKVGDWVVTPRRGKAVEINALWYNALRCLEGWQKQLGRAQEAAALSAHADRTYRSFNERFWIPESRYLFDVIDGETGDDRAIRPNQLFAISLDHPVLESSRWRDVMRIAEEHLLTPVGLRTLSADHPDFKPQYFGDLRARDAAYHQGTVWPWLIGAFIDAWCKTNPDQRARARGFLDGFAVHLSSACIGSISEVFDATPPYMPRACLAQAWSVAEVLRSLLKTES